VDCERPHLRSKGDQDFRWRRDADQANERAGARSLLPIPVDHFAQNRPLQCTAALLRALTLVIDRAGRGGDAKATTSSFALVTATSTDALYVKRLKVIKGFCHRLSRAMFLSPQSTARPVASQTSKELHDHLAKFLPTLRSDIGVLLFVFSVLMTRGISKLAAVALLSTLVLCRDPSRCI
jgi:hypothetical protein